MILSMMSHIVGFECIEWSLISMVCGMVWYDMVWYGMAWHGIA